MIPLWARVAAVIAILGAAYWWVDSRAYNRGFTASDARHAAAIERARIEFAKDDFDRQAIESDLDALARQSEAENHAAPVSDAIAVDRDRVRRANQFRP